MPLIIVFVMKSRVVWAINYTAMKHIIALLLCGAFAAVFGQSEAQDPYHPHFYLVGGYGLPGGVAVLERALSQDISRGQEVHLQWTPAVGFSVEVTPRWSFSGVWSRTGWSGEGIKLSHKMGILTAERRYLVRPRGYFYSGFGAGVISRYYYVDRPINDINSNDLKLILVIKPIGYAMTDNAVSLYAETGLLHTAPISAGVRIRLGKNQ